MAPSLILWVGFSLMSYNTEGALIKHPTPTQSFPKYMLTSSFSKAPLNSCHCSNSMPAPHAENKHPALTQMRIL